MSKTLTYNDKAFPLDSNKTLLENLESQAVPVEFHCREGHCGACRSILISGTVTYNDFPMAYLRDNEVLLCCARSEQSITISAP